MKNELKKREEELEEVFARQLELLKAESGDWLKVGGIALAVGLIAFALIKSRQNKKKDVTAAAMAVLEREGLLNKDIERKLNQKSKSGFWPSLSERLLIMGLAFAKDKFLSNLFAAPAEDVQVQEESKKHN